MEIGSKFVGDVKDLSPEGTGVVEHPSGMIFFVSGVWPGEVGEFIITERNKNFGMAKLVTLQSTHSDRREAECKHHGFGPTDCSNCAWQFISYSGQLEAKQSRVHKRLASYISLDRIAPIWGAPEEFGYRNRTQFKTDGKSIVEGFQAGVVDYIGKPFNVTELLVRVKTQLELSHSRREMKRIS